jgi:tocopherol cyclase
MNFTNLERKWRSIWNPDMYHGWGRNKSFFEGWYFKLVTADESKAFAIIPGISIVDKRNSSSFIQVLDGIACEASYHEFTAQEFIPAEDTFRIDIRGNSFSNEFISIDLPNLSGQVNFSGIQPWPASLGIPGVMGVFSFVPFMQCYHGVVSMNHRLSGQLLYKGETIDFEGGKGYIEKDWGSSFPKSWIWMQSNHFNTEQDVSFMFSLAHIPWMGSYFNGFLSGLWLNGKLYKMATYTGAKVRGSVSGNKAEITLTQGKYKLEIHAVRDDGGDLIAPVKGEMKGKVNESLQSHIELKFSSGGQKIFEGKGNLAGMEFAGDIASLLKPGN